MDEPDVFEGALRIAQVEYPDLDLPLYRARVEEFGRQGRAEATSKGRNGI